MKSKILILLLLLPISFAFSQDTELTRGKEADRYLVAMPLKELMLDMAQQMKRNQPPEKQAWIEMIFNNYIDYKELEKICKDSMVKQMTTDEIRALADFYGSPIGKSVMKKFGKFMADVQPALQQSILSGIEKSKSSPLLQKDPNA